MYVRHTKAQKHLGCVYCIAGLAGCRSAYGTATTWAFAAGTPLLNGGNNNGIKDVNVQYLSHKGNLLQASP